MEEKTLLQIRVNRKTGLYVVEGKHNHRSHMNLQETFDYIASVLVNHPFAIVVVKNRVGGAEIKLD